MIEIIIIIQSNINIFEYLQTEEFIKDLEIDPYLHGAGIHAYPNNEKIDIHPITKKRRVNLIIYLNNDWNEEYGGQLKLYENKIILMWNTAILFKTSDISYHGLPEPIKCPDNKYRKSIAIYYVSKPRENIIERYIAEFFLKVNQQLKKSEKIV
jgi:hypothetical protein